MLVFNFLDFVKSGNVTAAFKLGVEKVFNDNLDFSIALFRSQTADLGIVVQPGAVGGKDIMALGGADTPHFISSDAHADAGAAN